MKIFESNNTFSDVISYDDISSWESNVIFEGGTGTGKTYFVLNTLSKYCLDNNMKILFLCNRTALANEVRDDLVKYNIKNIDVDTYQKIEDRIKKNTLINKEYDFVVLDEFHHVLEVYNIYTDLSFKWVMKHPAKKLFMSATCSGLFNLMVENGKVSPDNHYYIPKDYSYVDKIVSYNKKNAYLKIINELMQNTNDKIIYFTQSLEQAIELYKQYEDTATFYCSKWTKNEKAKELLKENEGKIHNQTFEGRLLITTTALDVGITLKDYSIKHIVANIYDYSQLIQCLGRKRIITEKDDKLWIEGKEDRCTFYIRNYSKRELNVYRNTKLIEQMKLFKNDREKYNELYLSDRTYNNKFIYYNKYKKEWERNEIAFLKLLSNEFDLDYMTNFEYKNGLGEDRYGVGYKYFILQKLNCSEDMAEIYEEHEAKINQNDLTLYLDYIVGKRLYKEEQKELKEKFEKAGLNARTLGIITLNGYLKDTKLSYIINAGKDWKRIVDGSKNLNYGKTYWIVGKITY